ncbi:MAG: hypothetical protein ACKVH1_09580, partial [Alphaproteobacteria bacterium]
RYSDDAFIPVVLLRQGDLFRKMGAYDLERQKYYDVIKAAPKVSLDGKFDLNYVKQVAFIARSQIADSFYEEAGKLPQYEARGKYANAAEMYYRLAANDEANNTFVPFINRESIPALQTPGSITSKVLKTARQSTGVR